MINEKLMTYARTMARDEIMNSLYLACSGQPSIKMKQTKLTNKIYKDLLKRESRVGKLSIKVM